MKEFLKIFIFLFIPALVASGFWVLFDNAFNNIPIGLALTIAIFWASMLSIGLYLWGDQKIRVFLNKKLSPAFTYLKAICLGIFCISALLIFITLTMDFFSSNQPAPPHIPQKLASE